MGYLTSIGALISLLLPIIISSLRYTALSNYLLNINCTNTSRSYTENCKYAKNLNNLWDDLYNNTSQNHGFRNASYGLHGPDTVYGLSLCRGDVYGQNCKDCLEDARCTITKHCITRQAIIWYNNCQVKYSDDNFFGKLDTEKTFVRVNMNNASNPSKFNATAIGLLIALSRNAAKKNKNMFASGKRLLDRSKNLTLYAMAQCTRDLSTDNCSNCLQEALTEVPIYKGVLNSVGARVVGVSCNLRYEIYPFLMDLPKVSI